MMIEDELLQRRATGELVTTRQAANNFGMTVSAFRHQCALHRIYPAAKYPGRTGGHVWATADLAQIATA